MAQRRGASSLDLPALCSMVWRPKGAPGELMEIKQDVTVKTWDGTWTYHPKVVAVARKRRRTWSRS